MEALLVVTGIASVVLIAWFLGFFAWLRIAYIRSREARTLRGIESEGAATRAFIREVRSHHTQSSLDSWLKQQRERRTRRLRLRYVAICVTLIAGFIICLAVMLPSSGQTPNPTSSDGSAFDSVIQQVAVGNCVNFTLDEEDDNYPDPNNPQIVSCTSSAATFWVAWLQKDDTDFTACPGRYSSLPWWQSGSGTTICASRVYQKGQCTQGTYWKGSEYSWDSDSIIPCSSKPTTKYPFILEITDVTTRVPADCSEYWSVTNPVTRNEISVCLSIRAKYR